MAFNIASLAVRFLADTRGYVSEIRRAETRLRGFGRVASTVARRTAIGAVLGVGAAAASAANRALALQDLSRQTGKSIEDLEVLSHVAAQTRVPFELFVTTIRRLNRRASDAAKGSKTLAGVFAQLGVSAAEFVRLDAVDQVRVLSERLREQAGRVEVFAEMFSLLDTEGQKFLQTLTLQRDELAEMIRFARSTQLPVRRIAEATERAQQAGRRLAREGAATAGGWAQRLGEALGLVEKRATAVRKETELQTILNRTAISQAERLKLLESDSGGREELGLGRVVNRSLEHLGIGRRRGRGGREEVRDPQLRETNEKLGQIIGIMRNNASGRTVTFTG